MRIRITSTRRHPDGRVTSDEIPPPFRRNGLLAFGVIFLLVAGSCSFGSPRDVCESGECRQSARVGAETGPGNSYDQAATNENIARQVDPYFTAGSHDLDSDGIDDITVTISDTERTVSRFDDRRLRKVSRYSPPTRPIETTEYGNQGLAIRRTKYTYRSGLTTAETVEDKNADGKEDYSEVIQEISTTETRITIKERGADGSWRTLVDRVSPTAQNTQLFR